jgi:hypothetical protein
LDFLKSDEIEHAIAGRSGQAEMDVQIDINTICEQISHSISWVTNQVAPWQRLHRLKYQVQQGFRKCTLHRAVSAAWSCDNNVEELCH